MLMGLGQKLKQNKDVATRLLKITADSSLEIRLSRFEYLKYNGKKNIRHDNLWKSKLQNYKL